MKKLLSIILLVAGVLLPMKLWAQDKVYEPYFQFEGDNLLMLCDTEGATIYYVIEPYSADMSEDEAYTFAESLQVNDQSAVYSNPIPISENVIIKAVAVKQGMASSDPATLIYNYLAWKDLEKAILYGSDVLSRAQDNPNVDQSLKEDLQWRIEEGEHFYYERAWMDSHEAEHFTQEIMDIARQIEEQMGGGTTTAEPYAVLSDNNTVLTFYYDEHKAERNGMSVGPFNSMESRGWYNYADEIESVVFDASFANCTTLTNTDWWFTKLTHLTNVSGMQYLNTSNVTSMRSMFWDCTSLPTVDLSYLNTAKVKEFTSMFQGCLSLTSLDVSHFNTANATDMNAMFFDCQKVTNLDVSNFNTSNVRDMVYLFNALKGLTTLDLSNFNTSNVEDMREMFKNCENLRTVYVGDHWTTSNVTSSSSMFEGCTSIVGGQGTRFNENHIDVTYAHIDGGTENPGYFTRSGDEPWVEPAGNPEPYAVLSDNNTVLTFYYDDQKEARNGMSVGPFVYNWSTHEFDTPPSWYEQRENIRTVVFDSSFADCTSITSTAQWFIDCKNLTSIEHIENLKTDNVTTAQEMFQSCSSLTELDVTHFNTSKMTTMFAMFANMHALTSIDLSNFDTRNVEDFYCMFADCRSLSNLDLGSFNTEKVHRTRQMFQDCASLTNINVSTFNTANVTNMQWMFYGCSALTNINISNFNTSRVTTFDWMFGDCSNLASIQAGSANIPAEEYARIGNPNLLVYVNDASLAPEGVQNVVINGQAQEIILTDVTEGNNNWFCPEPFRAEKISYTRNFSQQTEVGISRGWESIALPFTVQDITHESKGRIIPFGAQGTGKYFWLRGYSPDGLHRATVLEANTPYVISMPNNTVVYPDAYNLNGRVTFSASNTTVPATPPLEEMMVVRDNIIMMPTFQYIPQNEYIYAVNVGQARDRYAEGSVFARDLRDVRPFEAYTTHGERNGARPNFIRIAAQPNNESVGIRDIKTDSAEGAWYSIDGRKLQGEPQRKGVYIQKGKKVVR